MIICIRLLLLDGFESDQFDLLSRCKAFSVSTQVIVHRRSPTLHRSPIIIGRSGLIDRLLSILRSEWACWLELFFLYLWQVNRSDQGKQVARDFITFVLTDCVRLEEFAVHTIELDEEILVKRERDFAQTNFIYHHEWNLVFFFVVTMVDHVHVNDVVLHDDIVSFTVRSVMIDNLWTVTRPDSEQLRIWRSIEFIHHQLLVLQTQLENNIENACSNVEITKNPNHGFELGDRADL